MRAFSPVRPGVAALGCGCCNRLSLSWAAPLVEYILSQVRSDIVEDR